MGGDVLLQAGQGDGAGRLGHGAQVLEQVAHGGGGLVGGNGDDIVEQGRAQAEGLFADASHGDPLGEQADAFEGDRLGGGEGGGQAGGLLVLDADNGDVGHELLDQDRDAGGQAAAAHGHEDAVEPGVLLDHLQTDGSLPGDDARVVEGGDEGRAIGGQALGLGLGGVEVLSEQEDLAAERAHSVDLDARSDGGHDDGGADAQDRGGAGHALGVVAGRCGHDAAGALGVGQGVHSVVGAADLEGMDGLKVLAFGRNDVAQTRGQGGQDLQGRVLGGLVDGGAQNGAQVAGPVPGSAGGVSGVSCVSGVSGAVLHGPTLDERLRDRPGSDWVPRAGQERIATLA